MHYFNNGSILCFIFVPYLLGDCWQRTAHLPLQSDAIEQLPSFLRQLPGLQPHSLSHYPLVIFLIGRSSSPGERVGAEAAELEVVCLPLRLVPESMAGCRRSTSSASLSPMPSSNFLRFAGSFSQPSMSYVASLPMHQEACLPLNAYMEPCNALRVHDTSKVEGT